MLRKIRLPSSSAHRYYQREISMSNILISMRFMKNKDPFSEMQKHDEFRALGPEDQVVSVLEKNDAGSRSSSNSTHAEESEDQWKGRWFLTDTPQD